MMPLGRVNEPDDIADTVVFLAPRNRGTSAAS